MMSSQKARLIVNFVLPLIYIYIYIYHAARDIYAHTAREAMRTMWKFSFCKQIEIKAKHAKKKRKRETGSDTKWYRQYCTEQI